MRITLLTDFGTADGYVAAMKGVIAEIAPLAFVDDASHAIPPGDIIGAAFALKRYWRNYPAGCAHVVVVDPGVGSDRRAIALEADGRYCVGPDNGVFTFVLNDAATVRAVELRPDEEVSRTFHGRDIFAPAAARLASGVSFDEIGSAVTNPSRLALPSPIATESSVRGEIMHVDRFGNLISNIPHSMLLRDHIARVAERELRVVDTYADAEVAEAVALINSDGMVEVAVRDGNAARALGVERGAPLELF